MPSLHSKWTACLLAVTFVFGIAGNASAATNPMTLNDLSQMVLGLKEEVDRLSKANKTLSKKLERIETQRYAARTPSSAYQMGNPERLMKARLSEPVRVASLGTTRVAEKTPTRQAKASDLENRITALEKQSHSEIRPYVRYDLAFGDSDMNSIGGNLGQPDMEGPVYPLSFGLGLRMSPSIRTDLTFDYYKKKVNVPGSIKADNHISNAIVLANAYYDFPSIGSLAIGKNILTFAPYVGGGLGFSYFWGEGLDRDHIYNPAEGLAGAAMIGVNVGVWRGLSADIGYRYAHLGFMKYDEGEGIGPKQTMMRLQRHDFRMGLRYAF
mgnify:CR=1 FL=1